MGFTKSSLSAYTITDQVVAAGDAVEFEINRVLTGKSIVHNPGSSVITLAGAGLFTGAFNTDFTISTTGPVSFQLYRNGEIVPGAEATVQAVQGTPREIAIPIHELVRPSCVAIDNTAHLQIKVSAAGMINTANINLVKDA